MHRTATFTRFNTDLTPGTNGAICMTARALHNACNPFTVDFDLNISHMYRNHPDRIIIIDDPIIDD